MNFDVIRPLFGGHMSQSQVDGTNAIAAAFAAVTPAVDPRWTAYGLATAFWETAHTMQPIREIGQGRGRAYGQPAGPWHQVYYGRGDVQETWLANYQHADAKLHALAVLKPEENLVQTPDLALRPDVAGAIMVHGMIEGWFTGLGLPHFFNDHTTDWLNARRIINGTDHAQQISLIAQRFYKAIQAQ